MSSLTSPEWKTKGGVISVLGPRIAASLFDDHDDAKLDSEGKMSFLDHLDELRRRLIVSLVATGISCLVSWHFRERSYDFISIPITQFLGGRKLSYLTPAEPFNLYMQLTLVAGVFLASPVILWQVWLFISPALYRREKRFALPFLASTTALFLAGGAFAYKIALPLTLHFLQTFGDRFNSNVTVTAYFDFAVTMVLSCAVLFEIPVLILFLTLLGIVTARSLLKNLRYAILIIFIVAAVVTPTPDIQTMMVFALPMLCLYLLGIAVAWIFRKKEPAR